MMMCGSSRVCNSSRVQPPPRNRPPEPHLVLLPLRLRFAISGRQQLFMVEFMKREQLLLEEWHLSGARARRSQKSRSQKRGARLLGPWRWFRRSGRVSGSTPQVSLFSAHEHLMHGVNPNHQRGPGDPSGQRNPFRNWLGDHHFERRVNVFSVIVDGHLNIPRS